jgi:hypothetical protein
MRDLCCRPLRQAAAMVYRARLFYHVRHVRRHSAGAGRFDIRFRCAKDAD